MLPDKQVIIIAQFPMVCQPGFTATTHQKGRRFTRAALLDLELIYLLVAVLVDILVIGVHIVSILTSASVVAGSRTLLGSLSLSSSLLELLADLIEGLMQLIEL